MRLAGIFLTAVVLAAIIIGAAVWFTPLPEESDLVAVQDTAETHVDRHAAPSSAAIPVETTLQLPQEAKPFTTQELQDELRALGQQMIVAFPLEPGSWHLAAQVEAELLQSDKAEQLWQRCLELRPQHFGPYLGLAELLTSKGRFQDAAQILERVFQQGGSAPEVYLKLGEAYENLGELTKSLEILSEGAELFPDEASLLYSLGRLQSQADELDAAEANIKRAIQVGGPSQQYLSSLISVLVRTNKRDEALTVRQQLKELTESGEAGQETGESVFQEAYDKALSQSAFRIFEGAANLCYKQNRLEMAEKYFVRAVEQDPSVASAWIGLSEVLLHQAKYGDVLVVLQRVVELEPRNPFHRTNLAAVAMQVRDLELAESTLEEALREQPDSELLLVALSKLYLGTGQLKKARQTVDSLLAVNSSPEVQQLRATIENAIAQQQ
jgi:tetratricopeptide (TPR) repeat protein